MFSVPPTMNTSPRPTIIFSAACVTLSKPDAQLRCTVTAETVSGTPARRAMTRAMLAASAGCATQPKMTSSMVARVEPRLGEQFGDGDAAQFDGVGFRERGAHLGKGRAHTVDDVNGLVEVHGAGVGGNGSGMFCY